MNSSATINVSSKTLLSDWERALLVLPALAGLFFGLFPLLLPEVLAAVFQFPAVDIYIYRLAGAATLGYGVALAIGVFQKQWLTVRLPVIATLVFNLASLYACGIEIFQGHVPYSVYLILASSLLFVVISTLLLVRHAGVPRLEPDFANPAVRIFLVVGAVAAAVFGLLPLFAPDLFTIFHLQIVPVRFVIRQAGAASFGYAVMVILAQRALNSRELFLTGLMGAIFNGVSGVVSIPYLLAGNILLLPAVIAPVGLLVLVLCLLLLRNMIVLRARSADDTP